MPAVKNNLPVYQMMVLGAGGAGKTSLVLQFDSHFFSDDLRNKTVYEPVKRQWDVDGTIISAEIVDTLGQDEYKRVPTLRHQGFLLLYSMDSSISYCAAMSFLEQIKRAHGDTPAAFMVVATHGDLAAERVVSTVEGKEFARSCGEFAGYIEVNTKERVNVDETFSELARQIGRLEEHVAQETKLKNKSNKHHPTGECCTLM